MLTLKSVRRVVEVIFHKCMDDNQIINRLLHIESQIKRLDTHSNMMLRQDQEIEALRDYVDKDWGAPLADRIHLGAKTLENVFHALKERTDGLQELIVLSRKMSHDADMLIVGRIKSIDAALAAVSTIALANDQVPDEGKPNLPPCEQPFDEPDANGDVDEAAAWDHEFMKQRAHDMIDGADFFEPNDSVPF